MGPSCPNPLDCFLPSRLRSELPLIALAVVLVGTVVAAAIVVHRERHKRTGSGAMTTNDPERKQGLAAPKPSIEVAAHDGEQAATNEHVPKV